MAAAGVSGSLIKTYPDNPALRKEKSPADGATPRKIRYFLQADNGEEIPVLAYLEDSAKNKGALREILGSGRDGEVYKSRTSSSGKAVKVFGSRRGVHFAPRSVPKELIPLMNEMFIFVMKSGICKHFNVGVFTIARKLIQREIHGDSLNKYVDVFSCSLKKKLPFNRVEAERMFTELRTALVTFSGHYAHHDIHLGNIMYDRDARCFVLIDFDQQDKLGRAQKNLAVFDEVAKEFMEIAFSVNEDVGSAAFS